MRRIPLPLAALVLCVGGLASMLALEDAAARPPIRKAFFNAYPSAVGSRLDNLPSHSTHCGVCHYDFNGGGARNPYGLAVQGALGTTSSTENDILSIQNLDSDGDGYTNLEEITDLLSYTNTPTFPGLTPSNVNSTVNVPVLSEIVPYLVPTTGVDDQLPVVNVISPNGSESWTGGTAHNVIWSASDNVGVNSVDVFYRDSESADWRMIARSLSGTTSFQWFVHDTPTNQARVRVVAYDAAGNAGEDSSNGTFTIVQTPVDPGGAPTTLRDFDQPGTQPFGGGFFQERSACTSCHGGYDQAVEPGFNFNGAMMGQSARDPLFEACLAIANQDAPASGDVCLRCHTPFGWMSGRSQPTDGSELTSLDRDGVACDFCHRAVNPIYEAGVSPSEDVDVLAGLIPGHTPTNYANGQYVIDPEARRRGPFSDTVAPHAVLTSPFHRSSSFCGTCHDVSNPAFSHVLGADYEPNTFDTAAPAYDAASLMPLERTFSEWSNSDYPGGVYAPDFAGNKADGIVASCQDCHMHDVSGAGCNDPAATTRPDLPLHDMTGGSAWMPNVIASLYPSETDATALAAGSARATAMLQKAAVVGVAVESEADSFKAVVTVTNRTGHKLPTGYPEGRRMWLHVVARDAGDNVVYEAGAYDPDTGDLEEDHTTVYQIELGISPPLADAIGALAGKSFHFVLNDSVYKDNRIPPLGFTNAAFTSFGGAPVDPTRPSPRYADGQNWDETVYHLPSTARSVVARLYYQSTSKEYVEFLQTQNHSNSAGDDMMAIWTANGRAAPVAMAADSTTFTPTGVMENGGGRVALTPARNPFHGALDMTLEITRPGEVTLDVFDAAGRHVARVPAGWLAGGKHLLRWNGRNDTGHDAGSGVFWMRVTAGDRSLVRQVVRLQ